MLPGLRFHLSESGALRLLLGILRLLTLRDSRLFRVETSHRIILYMTAFLGLHLALGNTDLLLLQGRLHDLRLFRSGFFTACIKFIRLHHGADKLALFRLERQMRCLLILRMQRRVELLLLRSLCILMQLAGIHRMLGFVERLLGLFTLFRVYGAGRNRLLILVKLAGVLPLLLGSGLRTGMGVAVCVRPADGRLRLLRLNDIFLRRCRAHSIARDFAACHADESAAEKACRSRASTAGFPGCRSRTVTAAAAQCAADRAGRGVDGAHGDHCF